ncbi:MAG: 16S rRNA (cytidine(1402)-2'-O)-methyltransferase [Chloroflexi bacterium]|nr:16S rRNA (cytidine(1402)-2'-O)-methyltransferase [Chloroflexota bacterium]
MPKPGCLFVVAVPIGHPKDITLRAIEVLQSVAAVICEEYREGSTLLAKLGIQNELIVVNEHNEQSESVRVVELLSQGKSLALISDCGTPVFADPGLFLLRAVVQAGLSVVPIPGPSSLTAALSVCDFPMERFVFGGFLPREKDKRRRELERLREMRLPIILMDTPYRMVALLQDVAQVFGNRQQVMLACDLTLPSERIYRGEIEAVLRQIEKRKSEFVLILR